MPTHHHSTHTHEPDNAGLAEMIDLDAEILHEYLSEATTWVIDQADSAPRRIIDIGSGTGTGTIALAHLVSGAEVIAVDQSDEFLARLTSKAQTLGFGDRVHTVQADLDAAWPTIDPVDLVWASMSMHHMADPDRVARDIYQTLRPGGLFAVAEMTGSPRFLPDDLGIGRPGLEARCHAVLADQRATDMPHLGADWAPHLEQAGFEIAAHRSFVVDLQPPHPARTGRYAQLFLQRMRAGMQDRMSADDLATLDVLIDSDGPDGVLQRGDLVVQTTRDIWLARRP